MCRLNYLAIAALAFSFWLAVPIVAQAEQAESGVITSAVLRPSGKAVVTGSVLCRPEGCGEIALVASPMQAKVYRKHIHGRAIKFLHYTSCRPKLETYVQYWNKEGLNEWRADTKLVSELGYEPPLEVVWQEGPLPQGENSFQAEFPLATGTATPCLYLGSIEGFTTGKPVETCLPGFKESIRRELCADEYTSDTLAKGLAQTTISR